MRSLKDIEENKKKVLETALQCFSEQGVVNTKIETIAIRSGVGERTIYRYFENKENIVLGAADLFWEKIFLQTKLYLKRNNQKDKTGIEQVEEVINLYFKLFFEESRLFILAIEAELFLYNNKISYTLDDSHIRKLVLENAPLYSSMKKGVEDGTIRKDLDFNVAYKTIASLLYGMIQKVALERFKTISDGVSQQLQLETLQAMVIGYLKNPEPSAT